MDKKRQEPARQYRDRFVSCMSSTSIESNDQRGFAATDLLCNLYMKGFSEGLFTIITGRFGITFRAMNRLVNDQHNFSGILSEK